MSKYIKDTLLDEQSVFVRLAYLRVMIPVSLLEAAGMAEVTKS
ncbi:MAG TPA: hypothetical protein VMC62_10170 [Longilinea sp.]|nr:hypothetical protein [Longilinea sp.]